MDVLDYIWRYTVSDLSSGPHDRDRMPAKHPVLSSHASAGLLSLAWLTHFNLRCLHGAHDSGTRLRFLTTRYG